ncbi:hypothetical protein BDQ94DRAFT_164601 [Aspergillus welwitschiae]|uniref:Uncharacterized protein n=1 Tax=Aspergillus welwitschiae TaxID=1341132 RepID=A0A3F3PIX1_9EURO|nr:hypothetical protein BDQ94DRAFT_164601 [Aspergillus welwitschiae]RDH26296.1 hypothetical protein BDQ94DRAFT_164601 [Aspergillus welwitschiae]
MDSAQQATNFLKKLGQLLLIFGSDDPEPLNNLQSRRLTKWKALLNGSNLARSRTQKHVQGYARQFASKVLAIAGRETLYLCMIEYSVSSLPKISYSGFYPALKEWSRSVQFPELLTKQTSEFWNAVDRMREGKGTSEEQVFSRNDSTERPVPGDSDILLAANQYQDIRRDDESTQSPMQMMSHFRILDATRLRGTAEDDSMQRSTSMHDRNESHPETERPLEVAFAVPPTLLDVFYQLHKSSKSSPHSAIITVPTQDRVASLVLSIPRTEAVLKGYEYKLPVIFNSRDLSENLKQKETGMDRNGTKRNGTKRNGTKRDGTKRDGTEQNGTEQNGTNRKFFIAKCIMASIGFYSVLSKAIEIFGSDTSLYCHITSHS